MTTAKAQSAGGKATAIILRKKAVDNYYENPNICKCCNSIIEIKDGQKVPQVKKKKFCNKSCAATFNNKGIVHNINGKNGNDCVQEKNKFCKICNVEITLIKSQVNGKILYRDFCEICLSNYRAKILYTRIFDEEVSEDFKRSIYKTKNQLFTNSKNWQSAASTIRKHARMIFKKSGSKKECAICGYSTHVQISHIKSVSEFDGESLIIEINDINNLVALCPNHHWELDHGILDKNLIRK